MIVTADPLGDFNATSQILRYSALAKEVTVPRMPSVASTVLSSTSSRLSGRTGPSSVSIEELEMAAQEIARITEEYEAVVMKLAEEEIARAEAEMKLKAAEERCLMIEQDVREECWAEMDERMEEERKRWQLAWDEQVSGILSVSLHWKLTAFRLVGAMSISTRNLSCCLVKSGVGYPMIALWLFLHAD